MFGAFLFSFGTSHGYVVISAGVPTGWVAGLEKFAVILAVANLVNCSLGAFGALHVVCKDPEEKEAPVMVVRATAAAVGAKGKKAAKKGKKEKMPNPMYDGED